MTYDPGYRPFEDEPERQGLNGQYGPSPASPLDSRYGGPDPWEKGLRAYTDLGKPNYGSRPFEGLGKTNVATSLPFAPFDTRGRDQAPTPVGAPQPGLFQAFGQGLTQLAMNTVIPLDMITEHLFGSSTGEDIEKGIANGIGAIGGAFDGILDFMPTFDFLPGGGDIEGTFDALPEDELKRSFDVMIAQNPTARLEYMKQFLDSRGPDIARMYGFSGDMGELAGPSASFSEQLRRIVFGGMTVLGNQTAKAYVNSAMRDIDGTVFNADMGGLPEELQAIRKRVEGGEITREEAIDEISAGQFRWTHDEGPGGMFINLTLDILTDPLIWASFGLGGFAKAGANGAVRMAQIRTAQYLKKNGALEGRMIADLSKKFKLPSEAIIKSQRDDIVKAKYDWAVKYAPTEHAQAIGSLGRTQKTLFKLDHIIQPAAMVANEIDTMFGMFGATHVGRRLSAFRGEKHVEGIARAVGVKRVQRVQNFFGPEKFDEFTAYFGIFSANQSAKMAQKVEVSQLLGADRAVDSTGKRINPVVDAPEHTPTQSARGTINSSMEEALPKEAEQAFLEYMEVFLPHGAQSAEAVASAMKQAKAAMARDLAAATGKTEQAALKFLEGADRREMSFIHAILYGRQVQMFNEAKVQHVAAVQGHLDAAIKKGDAAEVTRLTEELSNVNRLTLVSENMLTRTDAARVLHDINAPGQKGIDAAKDAVDRYDQLDINWGKDTPGGTLTGAELVTTLTAHLDALLKAGGALTDVVSTSKLNPRIAASLDSRYRVGMAPTDVWGITREVDGKIIGVNPFVEALSENTKSLSRGLTWYDRMKQGLAGPISGSRLHAEAKMRMRVIGASEFGMRRADTDALFSAINRESITRQKGARSFGAEELQKIADAAGVKVDDTIQAKYGGRALLHMVLKAYEGELAMMGVTSRSTSRLKSVVGRQPLGDNIIGKISEDLYPRLRFALSPIFLAMEYVEGPFFGILRGIKPGWRYGRDDVSLNSILEYIQPEFTEHGAGIGRAQLAYADSFGAKTVTEASFATKTWNKVMPAKFARNAVRIRGPRWYNVYEMKKLLYVRQAGKEAGLNWKRTMEVEFPEAYRYWQIAADSTDPTKVFIAFMEERGAFNPEARHAVHMFDAMKPDSMGLERIRMGDVAAWQGFETRAALREAIDNGSWTRDQFIAKYTDIGGNRKYAERAWQVADGFTEGEWNAALVDALGKEAAEGAMNFHQWMANAQGVTIEEFLNREYGQVAAKVDKARQVPGVALKQTVRASLEGIGATVHERGSRLHNAVKERSSSYLPESTRKESATTAAITAVEQAKTTGDGAAWKAVDDEGFNAKVQGFLDAEGGKLPGKKKGGGTVKLTKDSGARTYYYYDPATGLRVGYVSLDVNGLVASMEVLPSAQGKGLSKGMLDAVNQKEKGKLEQGFNSPAVSFTEAGKATALKWLREKEVTMGDAGSALTESIDQAQRAVAAGKGRPPGMSPERAGMLSDLIEEREAVYSDMYATMRHALGSSDDNMKAAANWYDEMTTMFLGLVEKMPDSMMDALMKQWDESAASGTLKRADGATTKALKDMTAEEKQVELAARLNIAFSGSQMNTSVLDGMKYVAKMLDEIFEDKSPARLADEAEFRLKESGSKKGARYWDELKDETLSAERRKEILKDSKGEHLYAEFIDEATTDARRKEIVQSKVETRYGFKVVGRRMEDLLRDFGNMDPEKIAQKLSDFNDNLAGRYTRTSSPVSINGVALQPAAMDIWMKRIFGHGDEAYLGYLADDYMRVNKLDPTDANRLIAEEAVIEHQGWGPEARTEGDAPTEMQYEWMLERTNEFKDWLNKEDIPGPNGEWAAHEIQALLWVGEQKRLQYEGTPTFGTLTQTGAQLVTEPQKTRINPNVLELMVEHGDEAGQVMANIQRDINTPLMASIAENTGVVALRTLDGSGTGSTNVVFASKDASMRAAGAMAVALDEPVIRIGNGSTHHTVDVAFDPVMTQADVKPYLTLLSDFVAEYIPDEFTHMSTALLDDNSFAVRSITKKNIAGTKKAPLDFDSLPPNIVAALEDGSWVKAFDPDAQAMPVHIERRRVDFSRITPEEGRNLVNSAELVNQYREGVVGSAERAYTHHAPESSVASEGRAALADGATRTQRVRVPAGGKPGGVRAGFKPRADASRADLTTATRAERAALYFVNNATDASTGVHEAFHLFARLIDDSAKRELLDAYNVAHNLTGRRVKRSFGVIEEWVAEQFEGFAAGDLPPNATYTATFKSFAEWGQRNPGIKADATVVPVFQRVLDSWSDVPGGFSSLDERRIWESARIGLLRAEEEAHSTAYYRRSPNWMGRTINHPYLGMYPANYMWGKVLPELTRFMLRRPFGLKAPMGGMLMYNHVHRALSEELATNPDLSGFIEDHPDTVRFLTMMLPGNPVEMPVNLPVVARRAMEHDAENRVRRMQGVKEEPFELAASVGDMISYSVGFANLPERVGDMLGEFAGDDGPNAGKTQVVGRLTPTPSAAEFIR